ncbi:NUDIX hydrolase [Brevibacillus fulvus]|uniref:8-oxo-dGTP pyrophosphatase MutT (NUDIX family) n=1 Tax=Brevibacillus fulvus TaxID=1125967 RepID=A0A938Y0G3_9BACL|nr:CoA pyrophosphatase [Brevibacillus fulvus]MBM7591639.1 8-oxo-dGTP pyrophosphatase MutT (NUDIX family) [Brevibacillus fulvus]
MEKQRALPNELKRKLTERQIGIMGEEQYRKTAVLIPLLHTDEGLSVLFTKRASTLRRQAGDISFPGGHREPADESNWMTARRETAEELQIPAHSIEYAADLDWVVHHARMIVYPFVGYLTAPSEIRPNPQEVAEVFTVGLDRLLNSQPLIHEVGMRIEPGPDFPYDLIENGKQYDWRMSKIPQLFYQIDGRVIWGLTARILSHFLRLVRD